MAHALLAALPVNEVVTTNYDELFELAARVDTGRGARDVLLPGRRARGSRWFLKMHGCVTEPASIVLTRTDYLRYAEERGALMGIVQALLMTRHMLFVGFSLDDPNFHRIADAVRRAVRPSRADAAAPPPDDRFGTALAVGSRAFVQELWARDLQWLSFGEGTGGLPAEAARRHDIFLDCLAAHARRADHLFHKDLRPREGLEAQLAAQLEALAALVSQMREGGEDSAALPILERALAEVGAT